jgi:hypothetical protein
MAINRAPWNALVDDDGSNLTGSVWNKAAIATTLLDPIDQLVGPVQTWTPTDQSGAGLSLAGSLGQYQQCGRLLTIWAQVQFPTTSNGAAVFLGGLPFSNTGINAGFHTTYGPTRVIHLPQSGVAVYVLNASTGTQLTNANMSGVLLIFQGSYIVT